MQEILFGRNVWLLNLKKADVHWGFPSWRKNLAHQMEGKLSPKEKQITEAYRTRCDRLPGLASGLGATLGSGMVIVKCGRA